MTRVIEFLISLAIVATLFLLIGIVLPSHRHLSEKTETNRKQTIVFDTLNSFRRFDDWNPLVLHDPRMQIKLSGPATGVGAQLDYTSNEENVGSGSYKITESIPKEKVTYAITNPDRGNDKASVFTLRPTGRNNRNVEIRQSYDVDYGWDILGRYAGLYVTRFVGDNIKMGLSRLTNMLASVPNIDYALSGSNMIGLQTVDLPAEHVLFVNSGSVPRGNAEIAASMNANIEWIKRTMVANGLQAAGPLRIVTNELGRETYNFDVSQLVRKGSGAPAPVDDSDSDVADADATAAETAPAAPMAAGSDAPMALKMQGPVEYVQNPARRAVRASYTGYITGLEAVRNALRAWALTQGYEVINRPYESYKSGVAGAFTETGQFDVYWDIK
ncbi:MAG: polyketide cyclase [Lysobacter sp.]|nr:polyketide cyclase [Lysobacter sp.]